VARLAARARQACFEYTPMPIDGRDPERLYRSVRYGPLEVFLLDHRSYRGANSPNAQRAPSEATALLGAAQVAWLKRGLVASTATWKIMASSLPIGLVVPDGKEHFEAVAQGDAGGPLGREHEIADLLRFIKDERIDSVVWITGDVHYAAAHHYHPSRARFTEFDPFWEFVAGPLHAGTFGPNALDPTFGPEVRFLGIPAGMKPNRPPGDGLQFFGRLARSPRPRDLRDDAAAGPCLVARPGHMNSAFLAGHPDTRRCSSLTDRPGLLSHPNVHTTHVGGPGGRRALRLGRRASESAAHMTRTDH
jgi:alkaline phosphatase D